MAQKAYERAQAIKALQERIGVDPTTVPEQMLPVLDLMDLSPSEKEGLEWVRRDKREETKVVIPAKTNKSRLVRFSVVRPGKKKNLCQMLGSCKVKQWARAAGILEIADLIFVGGTFSYDCLFDSFRCVLKDR